MALIISTWMYTLPEGDTARHPQMGNRSDTTEAKNAYWRCAFCMFASSHVHNPQARHILFCNELPPAYIDGQSTKEISERFAIEYLPFPSITRPPKDYYPLWNTQFIVLDVLDGLNDIVQSGDSILLLDGDMIFIRPLPENAIKSVQELGALTYNMHYPIDQVINGLDHHNMNVLSHRYQPPPPINEVVYCGGEFIFLSQAILQKFLNRARSGYEQSIEKYKAGHLKFCEEGHLLSWVYATLNIPIGTANNLVHRIWTDRGSYCNVPENFHTLTLWHLPAEKKKGFIRAFSKLSSPDTSTHFFNDCDSLAKLFRLTVPVYVTIPMAIRRLLRNMYYMLRRII